MNVLKYGAKLTWTRVRVCDRTLAGTEGGFVRVLFQLGSSAPHLKIDLRFVFVGVSALGNGVKGFRKREEFSRRRPTDLPRQKHLEKPGRYINGPLFSVFRGTTIINGLSGASSLSNRLYRFKDKGPFELSNCLFEAVVVKRSKWV